MESSSSKSTKSLSSLKSSQRLKGGSLSDGKRKVVINHKFDPSSTLAAPLSSPAVRVQAKGLSSSRSQPRWAPMAPDREEIASKPWYLLSFEEAAELLDGEQDRRERFGVFNKSFVTRLDTRSSSSSPLRFAFGSVVQPSAEKKTEKKTARKTDSVSVASSPRKTTTQTQKNRSSDKTINNNVNTAYNTTAVSAETAVERDVRLRRLHGQALKAEIAEIDEEISVLAKDMSLRAKTVQNLEREVSLSAQELQARRARAAHTLSLSLAAVDQLIAKHAHSAESASADIDCVGSNNDDKSNNEQLEYFLDLRAKIESKLAALEHVDRDI